MDAAHDPRERRKQQLLLEAAAIVLEQQREQGLFDEVPHYNQIEEISHQLGALVSRMAQSRLANETAAGADVNATCPGCDTVCRVEHVPRTVTSIDGPVELLEPKAHCPACRRDFFPSA